MRLLIHPAHDNNFADYERALAALSARGFGALLIAIESGTPPRVDVRFVAESMFEAASAGVGIAQLRECLTREKPALFNRDQHSEVLVIPIVPRPLLLIAGGGHVGQAVAAHASLVGFEIVVTDDRPEFTRASLFPPKTKTICAPAEEAVAAFPVDRHTFVVIVTRGHQHDSIALRACLGRGAAYIGMIGSRRKVPLIKRQFLEAGWATAQDLDNVYAPIGLDIGAMTVQEIAVSIVAQLIQVRRDDHHDLKP